jgi:hypothetical protein
MTDNPPAFPNASDYLDNSYGMTLRDWFAGQALAGIMANAHMIEALRSAAKVRGLDNHDAFGIAAMQMADAMLAARKEQA